jgi:hypothetical protein
MTSYLERYRAGEHEAVWKELTALGPRVFEAPVHEDALSVARETMRRVRHNVELLIERLEARGYRFADSVSAAEEQVSGLNTIDSLSSLMTAFAASRGGGPNVHAQNVMERLAATQAKFAPMLDTIREQASAAASASRKPPLQDERVYGPPTAEAPALIAQLERAAGGPLPLSLRAWYEEVGSVSLRGSDPVLNPGSGDQPRRNAVESFAQYLSVPRERAPGESLSDWYARLQGRRPQMTALPQRDENSLPDPLVVYPIDILLGQLSDREEDEEAELALAPDDLHKADISGDAYYVTLPEARADFRFGDWHKADFVDYLRAVFRWGGFPGWERAPNPPRAEIAALTEGLLPI